MSTLYDALKRAEAERKKENGFVQTPSGDGGPPSNDRGMSKNTKSRILLIAVLVVFAVVFYEFKGILVPIKPLALRTSVSPNPVFSGMIAQTPKPQRVPGTYSLDGVIDAGENSMAIINGKLLKPEETIDQLVLKKISPKEVQLLNIKNNRTVILKID